MTTRDKLKNMLKNNGMAESQAEQVMQVAIPELNQLVDQYNITWDRPAYEYPEIIHLLLFRSIRPIALKWIDKNIPLAWFRPMFM